MPNPEHLKILRQGVEVWNSWRQARFNARPDLSGADLKGAILFDADLHLSNLSGAELQHANLISAILHHADLSHANLSHADLFDADLHSVNLRNANLSNADLRLVNLTRANLAGADLTSSKFGITILADVDLSKTKGLNNITHSDPSTLGVDTIYKSRGEITTVFLRGCGLPESFIMQIPMLIASTQQIEFYSCFISYSSKDEDFANKLYDDLQKQGVRCWFAPEDLKIGDRFRDKIDESIRLHDKLLLILSENSVSSPWVSDEAESAMEREHRERRTVLFPIKIDDAVMESEQAWAAAIRRTRHIGDFTGWKDHASYKKAFDRLLRDLKAEESAGQSQLTPDSLKDRAVLSPRNTLKDEWKNVEDSIIQFAKREGLVKRGELVDCGQLVNQLHERGKITDAAREEFFALSKWHLSVAFNSSIPVEPQMAIDFVNRAKELQKTLAVDTPPLP